VLFAVGVLAAPAARLTAASGSRGGRAAW
jgi:hypothetical protein